MLLVLFGLYVLTCLLVPVISWNSIDVDDGLPWEIHLIFLVVFLATKAAELWIYNSDPTLASPLPVLRRERWGHSWARATLCLIPLFNSAQL